MRFPNPLGDLIDILKSVSPLHETEEVWLDKRQAEMTPNQIAREHGPGWAVGWVDWDDAEMVRLHRRKR